MNPHVPRLRVAAPILLSCLVAGRVAAQCDGRWSAPGVVGFDGPVYALQVWNDHLFAAGGFTMTPSGPVQHLASFDGQQWSAAGAGPGFDVFTLGTYAGELIAAGYNASAGHQALAAWNGSTWRPLPGYPGSLTGPMIEWNGQLAVGGDLLYAWDGSSWHALGTGGGMWHITGLTIHAGELYALWRDEDPFDPPLPSILRWAGTSWQPVSLGDFDVVRCIADYRGHLCAGGSFYTYTPYQYVRDLTTGAPLGRSPIDDPWALLPWHDGLLAIGNFGRHVASWDGTLWRNLGSGLAGGSAVHPTSAAEFRGDLWIGGYFLTAGGIDSRYLARWTCACYANCDLSTAAPVLNVNDFICFQQRFIAGDPYANCDQSTTPPVLNVDDLVCFQSRFAGGCP